MNPLPPLMLITDRHIARQPLLTVVEAALEAGCQWVQVREKDLADEEFVALATPIVASARRYKAMVSINGRPHLAAGLGADGVHLPQGISVAETRRLLPSPPAPFRLVGVLDESELPRCGRGEPGVVTIGVSTHSLEEARRAAADGADYITLSPIFLTESKPGYGPALGLDELSRVAQSVTVPVVALGGITPENAADCLRASAASVAVMGKVMRSRDPAGTVRAYLEAVQQV